MDTTFEYEFINFLASNFSVLFKWGPRAPGKSKSCPKYALNKQYMYMYTPIVPYTCIAHFSEAVAKDLHIVQLSSSVTL